MNPQKTAPLDTLREWLDALAGSLAPRSRPAVVVVPREPRLAPRGARRRGDIYRPTKG